MLDQRGLVLPGAQAAKAGDPTKFVRYWLLGVALLIFVIVMIGGATRLTESGLSITEWKPVTGMFLPQSDADWQAEFERYKQIPQYAALNPDMTLFGFKTIYEWEWTHRLLARLIGAAFILPALWFWWKGLIVGALRRQLLVATGLLALEPIVGWWMVSSGLAERIEVSQDRLATHLLIAAATFVTLISAAVGLAPRQPEKAGRGFAAIAAILTGLIFVQLGLGALVAGLRAGYTDNTWPLMDGKFLPNGLFGMTPWFASVVDDVTTVQFDHRVLAYLVVILAVAQAVAAALSRGLSSPLARRTGALAYLALLQALLGVATLILVVPIPLALIHQAMALALLGAAAAHWRVTALAQAAQ
ncbi:MAG: heme A synthase [Bradyrhizobium sp.]|nr:MAG: heme A synthase [Bradyrhizobium sp.]